MNAASILVLIVLASFVWVAIDARGYDWTRNRWFHTWWGWAIGTGALWIIVFPLYLHARRTVPGGGRTRCPQCAELVHEDARRCKHCGSSIA